MQSGLFDPKNQADLLKLGNEATIYGINYAFVIATWISVASFILAFFIKKTKPAEEPKTSENQEAAATNV